MTSDNMLVLQQYETIAYLNETHNVALVQNKETKSIYVKKERTVYSSEVYRYLQDHPVKGIPEIYLLMEDREKMIIIEEFVSGQTLQALLSNCGKLPEKEAVSLLSQICEVLRQLHNANPPIISRDLKPANIMITSDGFVRLVDMNAAKRNIEKKEQDTVLMGTVGYAAPEQYGFGTSDPRSDIYSLGILLKEMLTGSSSRLETVAGRLNPVIEKCTKMDPNDRYQTVEELLSALSPNKQTTNPPTKKVSSYMIPGFRTRNPSNMITAAGVYIGGYFLLTSMTFSGVQNTFQLWANRVAVFLIFFFTIFFTFNYRNVWNVFHLNRVSSPYLKALIIAAIDAGFFIVIAFIVAIILS